MEALAGLDRLEPAVLDAAKFSLQRRAAGLDGTGAEASATWRAAAATASESSSSAPEGVPRVLMRQGQLCVLWKPPGWAAAAATEQAGAEDEEEAAAAGDGRAPVQQSYLLRDWLAATFSSPIVHDASVTHGLVHRLDRQTSGALLWAQSYSGLYSARLQFSARRVRKEYVCLCEGWLSREVQFLNAPLLEGVGKTGLPRSTVAPRGRWARTEVTAVAHLVCPEGRQLSLVEVQLHTGRLHQIRAHFSHEGHPLVGDALYGGCSSPWCPRMFLHASRLAIDVGEGLIDVRLPIPADLHAALGMLAPADVHSAAVLQTWRRRPDA